VRGPALSRCAFGLLLILSALLGTAPAGAHGSAPEPRQLLLRADRPEQIILATNFGLIFSEDGGDSWLFSCERGISDYTGQYLLGAQPSSRIFGMTSGAGLIYSDDDSCSWTAARGVLTEVLPYAFAVDPSNSKRVYVIGVPRQDLRAGDGIYVSEDEGLTFGKLVFKAPARSALLTVLVAPGQPSRLYATMFSAPENHPLLMRSQDSGEHWELVADLVDSLGDSPFELLAIDPIDEDKLYVRILGPSAETLAHSDDGGMSFVQSVSIPGKLNAFLKLASGTILVGGMAGTDALAYRSRDGGLSFEPWPGAPHIHALAERNGTLYVAADNFLDGYAIAQSDDEGVHLRPLTGFDGVRAVRGCATELCAERCAYFASIKLWPETVCGTGPSAAVADAPAASDAGADGPPVDANGRQSPLISAGRSACALVAHRPTDHWVVGLVLASMLFAGRRRLRSSGLREHDPVVERPPQPVR
jgi:hypothetical protein